MYFNLLGVATNLKKYKNKGVLENHREFRRSIIPFDKFKVSLYELYSHYSCLVFRLFFKIVHHNKIFLILLAATISEYLEYLQPPLLAIRISRILFPQSTFFQIHIYFQSPMSVQRQVEH